MGKEQVSCESNTPRDRMILLLEYNIHGSRHGLQMNQEALAKLDKRSSKAKIHSSFFLFEQPNDKVLDSFSTP